MAVDLNAGRSADSPTPAARFGQSNPPNPLELLCGSGFCGGGSPLLEHGASRHLRESAGDLSGGSLLRSGPPPAATTTTACTATTV